MLIGLIIKDFVAMLEFTFYFESSVKSLEGFKHKNHNNTQRDCISGI